MSRVSTIGAYIVSGVLSVGGGFAVSTALTGGDAPAAERSGFSAYTTTAPLPADERDTIRNEPYGFRFRHPPGWTAGARIDGSVVASMARPDGVGCYVSVREQKLGADAAGRPQNAAALLTALTPSQVAGPAFAGFPTKVEFFAKANWLGQEARSFVIAVAVPVAGTLRLEGYATLRAYGALVLTCSAPAALHADKDVQAAFALVRKSFQFE